MPAAVAVPLIVGAAGAGATITGAALSSRAQNKATRAEQDYNEKALEAAKEQQAYERRMLEDQRNYERQQWSSYASGLQPFMDTGMTANQNATAYLSRSPYAAKYQNAAANGYGAGVARVRSVGSVAGPASAAVPSGGQTVTLAPPPGQPGQPRQFAANDPNVKRLMGQGARLVAQG